MSLARVTCLTWASRHSRAVWQATSIRGDVHVIPGVLRRGLSNVNQQSADRLAGLTRDHHIDTQLVRVKQRDGSLSPPERLNRVLSTIDTRTHTVIQLTKPGERDVAIVEIHEKMELLKQIRDKEAMQRQQERALKGQKPKQLELNWAISGNDLELKLRQLDDFLSKGRKVEIMLAAKRRQRRATPEEADAVLKRVREKIQEVGAKEIKPQEGQVLKQALLTVKKT